MFYAILGILGNLFGIGGPVSGVNLKANSGALEARNAADSAFVVVRGDTPIAGNDLTNKTYVDGLLASQVATIRVPFSFTDNGTPVDSTAFIPANAYILSSSVVISTAFDGATPTVQVGTSVAAAAFQGSTDSAASVQNTLGYGKPQNSALGATTRQVRVTVTTGAGSTAGAGFAIVQYAVPLT